MELTATGGNLEAELIGVLRARVLESMPSTQVPPCIEFIRQYYHWVPAEDLADRTEGDLYGAAISHWTAARRRSPGQSKVRVYNPDPERDGWRSSHTVIEIVSDDMPFIVDSVTMELSRQGYGIELIIHPVIRARRDHRGELIGVLEPGAPAPDAIAESVIHAEVMREPDPDRLAVLLAAMQRVLVQVGAAVQDWTAMRERAQTLATELAVAAPPVDRAELEETCAFLSWLSDDHFTFLGYREYELICDSDHPGLEADPGSGLGILRGAPARPHTELKGRALELARARHLLVLTKANSRSTVHRPAYLDYIGVKRFGPDGQVVGECRFLGLYTTAAYKASPREIPLLRGKVETVMARAGFPPDSHDAKALTDILESFTRDTLFQIDVDDLFEIAIGVLGLGERQRVRLFARRDQLDRFMSCLLCIPRDRFNTENRERAGRILADAFGASHVDWSLQLSESVIVRVNYIAHCPDGVPAEYDVGEIEGRIVEATRAWTDDLRAALIAEHGEEQGLLLYARYGSAFPAAYRADWDAVSAVADVERVRQLAGAPTPLISLYRPSGAGPWVMRCKLLSPSGVSLSDVLPTFEHMGVRVVDERPYRVLPADSEPVWIYDFGLRCQAHDLEQVRGAFADVFLGVWRGELEDDGLNGLVLAAGLTAPQIALIRAIARYVRQAGIPFSDSYLQRTLVGHPEVVGLLVGLFRARFDPEQRDHAEAERIDNQAEQLIDAVKSLDQDRILRSFLSVVRAMLRTNFYQIGDDGRARRYLSFKLDPRQLAMLPLPRPLFEIFVYSPAVEGIHLRGGKVARGGLRWSDRREDFRTEVLGLMKAQMVKNALIVPVGSKGGFVVKRPPVGGGREAQTEEALRCYDTFLCGLLDLTDNIVAGEVVAPDRVVRYDTDDPYLVVAADKGTATFSDYANEVSARYGFWLGDAFASGGSHGYDHKEMGITARGMWESVKRHFRERGVDIQQTDFTVVGIGDMSGDVFGNGMLLSPHIRLLAAFNHLHVFLDPDPDPKVSFAERRRLFELPRSSWSDYDTALFSTGGGVFSRAAKSIPISAQVKRVLGIDGDALAPTDLIRKLLSAPVDLLFNGGIGTYVKAADETHADAGDKSNDAVRVDGNQLRCRVVGEGGNLGLTQRGRIEYALRGGPDGRGGQINTDAIDNVAGVNCSDHEVNIKVLLDGLVAAGEMSEAQRNDLLVEMTDAVASQVLVGSYTQTQAMSLALHQAASMVGVHARLIRALERVGALNRELEYLPSEKTIDARRSAHQGLVAPELAVVMAYCKIHLYVELLDSDLPDDPYLAYDLERYFPPPLGPGSARPQPDRPLAIQARPIERPLHHPAASPERAGHNSSGVERFAKQMRGHRLRREIVATLVANQLVDRAGTTFAFRLAEETGAPVSQLARAFAVAREVFDMRSFWSAVQALDNRIEAGTQISMLLEARRLLERATRWLVRANAHPIDIARFTRRYQSGAGLLAESLPRALSGADRAAFAERFSELEAAGVPRGLATRVASMQALLSVFDIVEDATASGQDQQTVTAVYFTIGSRLELDWLRDRILELPRADRWQALARAALRDDLYSLHRSLTHEVLRAGGPEAVSDEAIDLWWHQNAAEIERCLGLIADIQASHNYDTTTLPVALREVRNLILGTAQLV